MAIIYTINDQEFEIGSGFASQGQAESPAIINPFPKYSIQREILKTEDGSYIGNKYSITITGQLIVPASADMTVSGERQNALHKQLLWHLQTLSGNPKYHNIGKLEIVPYGGGDKPFIFADARLVNVEIPEQSDESSGVLYSDYTFSFEAYKDISDNKEPLCLGIESIEESWELNTEDSGTLYPGSTGNPYKIYTITHTVNAVGYKDISTDATEVILAWKRAADFVKTRLVSKPSTEIVKDMANLSSKIIKTYHPDLFGYTDDANIFGPDLTQGNYDFYNHIRTPNCNFSAGSYSVTETWTASNMPATLEMDIEAATDENEITTMTLSGTITGLDQSAVNTKQINKLANAETILSEIDSNAYTIVSEYYPVIPNATLANVIRSKTVGRNKITGVITFNYVYNDSVVLVPNSISSSITITDDNEKAQVQTIAILPIIAKANGPVIQNMATTPEKKRSIQIDAVMKRGYRTQKPNVLSIANNYKPTATCYVQSYNESWEPGSGTYNLSLEWVYI